jgi:hypothetical protein
MIHQSPYFYTMKNITFSLAVLAMVTLAVHAQNFALDWHKIAGGGGTSSNGRYSVSGTIGQHDASQQPMSSGNFSLTGGFWSLTAVQAPNAPLLSISLTSSNTVMVSWPTPSTGFVLQQNSTLSVTNWITPLEPISDDGTNKFIMVNPPAGNRFFRLSYP